MGNVIRVTTGLIVFAALMAASCGPAELLTYTHELDSDVTVPGAGVGINNPLAPGDVFPIDFGEVVAEELAQTFDTEGINKAAVESLKVTRVFVEVTNAEDSESNPRNLAFLDSLAFDMETEAEGPVRFAESAAGAFEDRITEYEFPLTNAELADVFKSADDVTVSTEFAGEQPTFDTDLQFTIELTIVADPVGAVTGE
jgi:hypothetical protein